MRPAVVLVTDDRSLSQLQRTIALVVAALPPEALLVQLRDKTSPPHAVADAARALRSSGARVVINAGLASASIAIALEVSAAGVHVPCTAGALTEARSTLGDAAWISTPAHSNDDVRIARDGGATAALVSPIFATPGKGSPRGVSALSEARAMAGLLVYALGGVDVRRAAACAEAGADGVAVIRALLDAADPAVEARGLAAPFLSR